MLEQLLLNSQQEIARLQNTVASTVSLDPNKRYVVITENELLKEILPDNVLVLPEKYIDLDLARNIRVLPDEQERIENWLMKYVSNAVVPEDVISFHGDKIAIGGRLITAAEVVQIRSPPRSRRRSRPRPRRPTSPTSPGTKTKTSPGPMTTTRTPTTMRTSPRRSRPRRRRSPPRPKSPRMSPKTRTKTRRKTRTKSPRTSPTRSPRRSPPRSL